MAGISDNSIEINRDRYENNLSTNNETQKNKKAVSDIKITMAGVQEYLANNGINLKDNDLGNIQSIFTASNTDKTNDFDDNGNAVETLGSEECFNFINKLKQSSLTYLQPIVDFINKSYENTNNINKLFNNIESNNLTDKLIQEYKKLEEICTQQEELKKQFANQEISPEEYAAKKLALKHTKSDIEANIQNLKYDLEDVDPETYQKLYENTEE